MQFCSLNCLQDKSYTFERTVVTEFPSHVQLLCLRKANHQLLHWHLGWVL